MKIITQIVILSLLFACGNNSESGQSNVWEGTRWELLDQENIKLRIPDELKRSSRYRIQEDLPILARDSTKLSLLQKSLEMLEFDDAEIDVFIDTSKIYRIVIICNTSKIDFGKTDAAILKQQMISNNEQIQIGEPSLEFGEVSAKLKANQNHKLAAYSYQIENKTHFSKTYTSIYYLSGSSYTLVVYEFSADEVSIEKYLWTTKV